MSSEQMTPEGHKTLRHGRLLTPLEDSMCGVNLQLGKLYVIAGQGAQLNLCNYVKEYQKMSIIERKGFSGVYRKACGCEVSKNINKKKENFEAQFYNFSGICLLNRLEPVLAIAAWFTPKLPPVANGHRLPSVKLNSVPVCPQHIKRPRDPSDSAVGEERLCMRSACQILEHSE